MSTFYVLPPRPLVGHRFAELLGALFPGTAWPRDDWSELAEALGGVALASPDIYVVYREDVAEGPDLLATLARDFGAEPGDAVVEVQIGARLEDVACRRQVLPGTGHGRAAA